MPSLVYLLDDMSEKEQFWAEYDNAIGEVLACHADAFAPLALKLAFVDEIPFLHALTE